jgi:hypothetical protein
MNVSFKSHHMVNDGALGQIYQAMACKQALLLPTEEGFTRITPLVLCRDFLVDCYTFDEVDRKFEIYGMGKPAEKPSRDGVFLLLTPPNKAAKDNLLANISFIHNVEIINGFKLTQIDEVEGDDSLVISGDKKWLMSCLSLSLYSSLLRVACYELGDNWIKTMREQYKEKKNKATDAMLVASVSDATWGRILSDLSVLDMETFTGFDAKKTDEYIIHHNQGFYSVFGNHRELYVKEIVKNLHWQHFSKEGYDLHTKAA